MKDKDVCICLGIKQINLYKTAHFVYEKSKSESDSGPPPFLPGLIKAVGGFFGLFNVGLIKLIKPVLSVASGKIESKIKEVGVTTEISVINKAADLMTGERAPYNILISVESIDYKKLSEKIKEKIKATDSKPSMSDGPDPEKICEAIRIVAPFIGDTFKTIPTEAINELINLLVREKVFEEAADFGIRLSGISLKTG